MGERVRPLELYEFRVKSPSVRSAAKCDGMINPVEFQVVASGNKFLHCHG